MTPHTFLVDVIDVGLLFVADLEGPKPTDDVRRFLLAIALQESGPALDARYQGSPGEATAAKGFFQFEQGGGVKGVLTHAASKELAAEVCKVLTVVPDSAAVWRALEGHDLLAVAFARLLVLTDPYPVPVTEETAWDCYNARLWRPGDPRRKDWTTNWQTATETVAELQSSL